MNPTTTGEFGEVENVNENMCARISHHRVDENYVSDSGLFFKTRTGCANMEGAMFDEELKVEVANVATSYEEKVWILNEVVCDLVAVDDQEEDKVIQEVLMRISINCIIVQIVSM